MHKLQIPAVTRPDEVKLVEESSIVEGAGP